MGSAGFARLPFRAGYLMPKTTVKPSKGDQIIMEAISVLEDQIESLQAQVKILKGILKGRNA